MAAVDHTRRSGAFEAASRALDAAVDAVLAGEPGYASKTTFVPADLVRTEPLARQLKHGPVVVVDADGNETRIGGANTTHLVAIGIAIGVVVLWAYRRALS
ncbi:MAG: hypothetical protein QOH21_3426 [Acidobacteriota bacterium]|jgi:hypothetical protein|nr:hypothetical protein [Acidobacteriota bacterium]